jgi:paraquat-inducible protein B
MEHRTDEPLEDRTVVLFGGMELTIGRGPAVDGLVFFDLDFRDDSPPVAFAMDVRAGYIALRQLARAILDAEKALGSTVGAEDKLESARLVRQVAGRLS